MKKILIFGCGQISDAISELIIYEKAFIIEGYVLSQKYISEKFFKKKKIYPIEEIEKFFPPNNIKFLTAVSYKNLNSNRENIYKNIKRKGYKFENFISKSARLVNSKIGENNIILENNNIQNNVEIGNNNIFWSGNHVGHDTKIGDNNFISTNVVISGAVKIGNNNFFGVSTTIRDNIEIGHSCVLGAGSIILRNIQNKSITSPKSTEISKVSSDKLKKI